MQCQYATPFLRLQCQYATQCRNPQASLLQVQVYSSAQLFRLFSLRSSCCLAPSYSNPTRLKQRSRSQTWAIMPNSDKSKGSLQTKTMKFWTLSEKGGGSAPQPNFLSMKSMDMCREGGVELLVQNSLLYKSLFCRSLNSILVL